MDPGFAYYDDVDHKMQIQDPRSDGCGCGCGLCPQVKNFCTKVPNLTAKPKVLNAYMSLYFSIRNVESIQDD